jgi:mannose-6-phosphate isomerase-like protein (cupin superfamily)
MLVRCLEDCEEFPGGDKTTLREILHPDKQGLELRYSLAHAVLESGAVSLRHRLAFSEVYYILEGEGLMRVGDEERRVSAGSSVYIPPGAIQWIENVGSGDLKFLCIVDPAWRTECEEVLQGGS